MNKLEVRIGQYSDKGSKATNQDFYGAMLPQQPLLDTKGIAIAIADGISSSEHGHVASESCVTGLLEDYFCTPETWSVKKSVEQVLTALNTWLYSQGRHELNHHRGLVTTLSAMVLKSATAHLIHVGDSRIYHLRQGYLKQLTVDHRTWVSKDKNYLTRAMGADTRLQIDYSKQALETGDLFILTTDGAHEYLSSEELLGIVRDNRNNLNKAAELVVRQAQTNQSPDNVTCQLVEVIALPSQKPDDVYNQLTELPFPPELGEGMLIDGYRIIRELHVSSRSQLYLALDTGTGLNVCLKTPSINYQDDPAYIERFIREEWIGRRVNNLHVMKIYEPARRRRFHYHIAEYIEGTTLRQWLLDHPRPLLEEVRRLVEQIAQGLQAFHRLEMLHQDLKPENILIDKSGTVKLVDFGSAKVAGIAEIATPVIQSNLLGTRDYTAPEYAGDRPGSNRSDIYSLGVIAYELLTGELPYGEMPTQWWSERLKANLKYTPVSDYNNAAPAWLDGAVKKAVHLDPDKRYAELSEFLYDLRHPNPGLNSADPRPLLERNPGRFWQGVSVILFGIIIFLLVLLARR